MIVTVFDNALWTDGTWDNQRGERDQGTWIHALLGRVERMIAVLALGHKFCHSLLDNGRPNGSCRIGPQHNALVFILLGSFCRFVARMNIQLIFGMDHSCRCMSALHTRKKGHIVLFISWKRYAKWGASNGHRSGSIVLQDDQLKSIRA